MKNYKDVKAQISAFETICEKLEVDLQTTNSDKEYREIESTLEQTKKNIAELETMLSTSIHVSITDTCRSFSPCEFDIPIKLGSVNYMVGSNGSGKTTILQKIRSDMDSLYDINKNDRDGMTSANLDIIKFVPIKISGVTDKFTHIFALDSIEDDPSNFINSSTAYGLVAGGGLAVQHRSKGEKSKIMLSMLITKIQKVLGFTIDDYKKGEDIKDCRPLILIDEIDEGMDFKSMLTYDHLLSNLCNIFNATVICVTHNPLVCFGSKKYDQCPVFDIKQMKQIIISDYITNETGMRLQMVMPPSEDKQDI